MWKTRLLFTFFLLYIFFSYPIALNACRCSSKEIPEVAYNYCDVVFSGVVIDIEIIDGNKKVYIDLINSWKISLDSRVIVWTQTAGPSCGYPFNINEAYLIYGFIDGDTIFTDVCTRTSSLNYADEDLDFLASLDSNKPTSAILFQNYPNPFNSTTDINFAVINPGNIIIEVYNSLGQRVAGLVNGFYESGYYSIKFSTSGLSSGIYFYRLKTAGTITKKMILLK